MAQFLADDKLSEKIKYICEGDNLRVACAFIGKGFNKHLLKTQKDGKLDLICDISMGGTNPDELKTLGAPNAANLKHLDNFHAKVFLSDNGVVAGSANASENGIGWINSPLHQEAGVFYGPKTKLFKKADKWFAEKWGRALQIDKIALKAAKTRFKSGMNGQPSSLTSIEFIEALKNNPSVYKNFGFVVTTSSAPTREVERIKDHQQTVCNEHGKKNELSMQPKNSKDLYSSWGNDAKNFPRKCIAIHVKKNRPISYVKSYKFGIPFKDCELGWCLHAFSLSWKDAQSELPGLPTQRELRENSQIMELAKEYSEKQCGKLFVNGTKFAKALTEL